jgi:hypothetical protein
MNSYEKKSYYNSNLGFLNLNHLKLAQPSYSKKSVIQKIDTDFLFELPMTYFRCGLCNSLEIESCKCNPANYTCKKCNWVYKTHNHELKMIQEQSFNSNNNINQKSILMKAIKK